MKKYYMYIAVILYILAVVMYVCSIILADHRTIFMSLGSCAMVCGALLTVNINKNKR